MADAPNDRLDGLDRLISEVEERRVEQMLYVAFLMADDADTTEAEDGLRQIEALLSRMRAQRVMHQSDLRPEQIT